MVGAVALFGAQVAAPRAGWQPFGHHDHLAQFHELDTDPDLRAARRPPDRRGDARRHRARSRRCGGCRCSKPSTTGAGWSPAKKPTCPNRRRRGASIKVEVRGLRNRAVVSPGRITAVLGTGGTLPEPGDGRLLVDRAAGRPHLPGRSRRRCTRRPRGWRGSRCPTGQALPDPHPDRPRAAAGATSPIPSPGWRTTCRRRCKGPIGHACSVSPGTCRRGVKIELDVVRRVENYLLRRRSLPLHHRSRHPRPRTAARIPLPHPRGVLPALRRGRGAPPPRRRRAHPGRRSASPPANRSATTPGPSATRTPTPGSRSTSRGSDGSPSTRPRRPPRPTSPPGSTSSRRAPRPRPERAEPCCSCSAAPRRSRSSSSSPPVSPAADAARAPQLAELLVQTRPAALRAPDDPAKPPPHPDRDRPRHRRPGVGRRARPLRRRPTRRPSPPRLMVWRALVADVGFRRAIDADAARRDGDERRLTPQDGGRQPRSSVVWPTSMM